MSREYVYFLSHAPTGSLCSIGSLCSLGSLGSLPLHFASDIYGLIQKVKSPQKKRSCSPSQHRTLRPFPYTSAIRHMASSAGLEPAREITMGFESIPLTTRARRRNHKQNKKQAEFWNHTTDVWNLTPPANINTNTSTACDTSRIKVDITYHVSR